MGTFLGDKDGDDHNLTFAMSFIPLARSGAMLDYYGNIEGSRLSDGVTSIVAIDFGLKDALFNSYLIQDASYLLFGLLVIFLSVSHDVDGEGGVDHDVDGEGSVDHKVCAVFRFMSNV